MAEDGENFDFEALDDESSELSALVTMTPSSSAVGDEDFGDAVSVNEPDFGSEGELVSSSKVSYSSLRPHFITVLSDFGEIEKFIIEGDSLLSYVFEHDSLDWEYGGQVLQVFYVLERFLSQLVARGSIFALVFFESHSALWQGARLLVRRLMISHLERVGGSHYETKTFESPACEGWKSFCSQYNPATIAVSDQCSACLRSFALDCFLGGHNLFFLEGLQVLDGEVKAFYVSSPGRSSALGESSHVAKLSPPAPRSAKLDDDEVSAFLERPLVQQVLSKVGRSLRLAACLWACSKVAAKHKTSGSSIDAVKLFIQHVCMLDKGSLKLCERSRLRGCEGTGEFCETLRRTQHEIIESIAESAWLTSGRRLLEDDRTLSSLADFSDGLLLHSLSSQWDSKLVPQQDLELLELVWRSIAEAAGISGSFLPLSVSGCAVRKVDEQQQQQQLEPMPIVRGSLLHSFLTESGVDDSTLNLCDNEESAAPSFLEDKGWKLDPNFPSFLWTHSRDQSASLEPSSRSMSEWEKRRQLRWKARQSQMYFRHLHEYAASLTGTTVLGATAISSNADTPKSTPRSHASSEENTEEVEVEQKGQKGKGKEKKPKEKKLSKKEQMLLDIQAKKAKGTENKLESEWRELQGSIKSSSNAVAKIKDLEDFARRCISAQQPKLAMQVALERLRECKSAWQEDREGHKDNMKFAILTMEMVYAMITVHLEALRDVTWQPAEDARVEVLRTMIQLGFTDAAAKVSEWLVDKEEKEAREALDEEVKELLRFQRNKLSVFSKSSPHFQLEHMGHLLPRPPPKVKDPRIVTFTPDDWQRELLDVVDNRDSALVCAPTSSGKTFISYYCMEKIMRDSRHKDGILVFVAPTKALINQIAAQVYGSFHSAFGIFTDSYRHRALTCRILVTVPECFEALLMDPDNAAWALRIRYVILDEVHCISSSEEGRLWERILLFANAPFLALSATVGEPEQFVNWLQAVKDLQRQVDGGEERESYTVKLVQHHERWVDLRRHVFVQEDEDEDDEEKEKKMSPEELVRWARLHARPRVDHSSSKVECSELLDSLHPLASFTDGQLQAATIPANLKFEPRDSLLLYEKLEAEVRRAREEDAIKTRAEGVRQLDPQVFFQENMQFVMKPQAVAYEQAVKEEFLLWVRSGWREPAIRVLRALGNKLVDRKEEEGEEEEGGWKRGSKDFVQRLFKLCSVLHKQDRLPAVIFNFERGMCERIALGFNEILKRAEETARAEHAKTLKTSAKSREQKEKMQKRMRDKVVSEKKEEEMLQELAEMGEDRFDTSSMDEAAFKSQFTFVQEGRSSAHDFDRITESARKSMGESHPLIQILRRGIGIHHSGLQNKYRMAVEMLFRCGFLRLVVATETLAFGINMPCRSVVFAGDHVSLSAIQYQQMSGRAGRRGLDVLGHVIFFDVPRHKLHRLLVAPVPSLKPRYPLSSSLLLRFLAYLSRVPAVRGVSRSVEQAARSSIARSLLLPHCAVESPAVKLLLPLHVKFAVDLLLRLRLIDARGEPEALASLAQHLHFLEPSNLAFLWLLQNGVLHELCQTSPERNMDAVARDLLLVLSFFFVRHPLHQSRASDQELLSQAKGAVVLPPLSEPCRALLLRYNSIALLSAVAAAEAAARGRGLPAEATLPLSGLAFHTRRAAEEGSELVARLSGGGEESWSIRSPFLSGSPRVFRSYEELISSADPQLGLHENLSPVMEEESRGRRKTMSAFVLDFYQSESLAQVCRETGVSSGEAWQGLRQLQLLLSSFLKALQGCAPSDDVVLVAVSYVEQKFSSKFFSKLYK